MLDSKLLKNTPEVVEEALKKRGLNIDLSIWKDIEDSRKKLQSKTEELQFLLNNSSKEIGNLKKNKQDTSEQEIEASSLTKKIKNQTKKLDVILKELNQFVLELPNIPDPDVSEGKKEEDNLEIRYWGDIPNFSFSPKDHLEIGEILNGIDMEAASRIAGSRFSVLKSDLAKLHRSLIHFMLDTHINEHYYQEVYVPYIVNEESLIGTGQLPKFEEDLFRLKGEQNFYLTSTAEIPVTNLLRDQIVESKELPLKWVCHTPCFRSEAGSYGRDTKGIMRVHQFEKVELVQAVEAVDSEASLEELTGHAETVMKLLEIPYRVVSLCAGELGFSAAKTYDIEAWIPSQSTYREISSCSNFRDFQSRRMRARWRNTESNKNELLHTLNGSGLAVGRTLIAILELNQNKDGSVTVPEALKEYIKKDKISPN